MGIPAFVTVEEGEEKAQQGRPPGIAPKFSENPLRLLRFQAFLVIINAKSKNAAARRCANTHEPAQVPNHLHNGQPAAPQEYYTIFSPSSQGVSARFLFLCCDPHKNSLLTLCRAIPCMAFLFFPRRQPGGLKGQLPGATRGEKRAARQPLLSGKGACSK